MNITPAARPKRPRALLAIVALFAATATAACGDDGDDARPLASGQTSAAADHSVEVVAADYRFEGLPAEVAAGADLTLRNRSDNEVHELVAMQVPDEETRSAEALTALPEQELGALFGGPPALVLIAPSDGESFAAVGDGTLTEPGRYLVMCFIPTGADARAYLSALEANPGEPPSVPGGPPHFTAGMYAELTVR